MAAAAPGSAQTFRWRRRSVLPGFGLSLGYTIVYLSLIVLIPLAGLGFRSATLGWSEFWRIATDPRVVSALQRMPELRALHSVAGVFDLLAVVEAEDVPSLDAAIDKIGAVEGVERTQSSIILSTKFER